MRSRLAERLYRRFSLIAWFWHRARWSGIRLAASARILGPGSIGIGHDAAIEDRARLIVQANAKLILGAGVFLGRDVEIAPQPFQKIEIGRSTSFQDRCVILGDVSIGAYCIFSYNVYISSGRHHFDETPAMLVLEQDRAAAVLTPNAKTVVVGEDCFVGINVVIMPGVSIGRGCVIGSNSVVTRSLPPYSVAAGSPARILRQRLNFEPPITISAADPSALPYFYSGFRRPLLGEEGAGGLVADGDFTLWLAAARDRHILLKARAIEGNAEIRHSAGEMSTIGGSWSTISIATDEIGFAEARAVGKIVLSEASVA